MDNSILGAVLAFLGGAAVSAFNARLAERVVKKDAKNLTKIAWQRQLVNVGYLVLVFLLTGLLPWKPVYLLVGAALGLTIPSFIFTWRFIQQDKKAQAERASREERGSDGT